MVAVFKAPRVSMSVEDKNARRALARFSADVNRALTRITEVAKRIGIGVGVGLAFAIKKFADFEASNIRVQNIMQATDGEMRNMEKSLLALSRESPKTAVELSGAWQKVAEAGVRGADSIKVLEAATNAAVAAQSDLVETTDQVTDVVNIFGIALRDAGRVADVMVRGSQLANTTIDQLGEALRRGGGRAAQMGISVEETTAALLGMANVAKGERAGTGLNSLLSSLAKNNERVAKANPALSIYDETGAFIGLTNVIANYEKALKGATDEQAAAMLAKVGDTRATALLVAAVTTGAEKMRDYTKSLEEANGTAKQASDKYMESLKGSVEAARSAVEVFAITLGGKLAPTIRKVAEWVKGLAVWLDGLSDSTITNAIKWAGLTAKYLLILTVAGRLARGLLAARAGVLALSAGLKGGLVPALKLVRLNGALMWGALTLGLTVLLTYLPEIIGWFRKLLGVEKEIFKTAEEKAAEFMEGRKGDPSNKSHASEFAGVNPEDDAAKAAHEAKLKRIAELDSARGKAVKKRTEEQAKAAEALLARLDGEKEFYDRRLQLQQDFEAAKHIVNAEERGRAMELLAEERERLIEEERQYQQNRIDVARRTEEILREIKGGFTDTDKDFLAENLLSEDEAEKQVRQDELKRIADQNNKKLLLEKKHGKALGSFIHATNSERFKGTQKLFGDLAGLAKEFGKEGFIAFKIFSIAEGVMNTIKAVSNALAAPYPPPIPQILAGVAGAMGAAQVAKMAAQQPPAMAQGGFVPGLPSATDNTLIHAASGEGVLPRKSAEQWERQWRDEGYAAGFADGGGSQGEGGYMPVSIDVEGGCARANDGAGDSRQQSLVFAVRL